MKKSQREVQHSDKDWKDTVFLFYLGTLQWSITKAESDRKVRGPQRRLTQPFGESGNSPSPIVLPKSASSSHGQMLNSSLEAKEPVTIHS